MKSKNLLLTYFALGAFVIALDRITKYMVLAYVPVQGYRICSFMSIEVVFNRGISWGLFHSSHTATFVAVSALIIIIVCWLLLYSYRAYMRGQCIVGEVLVCAGAFSNIVDRIVFGAVVDFILLSLGKWSWPIFNIADAAIVVGVGLMLKWNRKK